MTRLKHSSNNLLQALPQFEKNIHEHNITVILTNNQILFLILFLFTHAGTLFRYWDKNKLNITMAIIAMAFV